MPGSAEAGSFFVWSTGDPNEVHGRSHQADERDPEWNQDFEVLRLGEGLPGASSGAQREGAQSPEEVPDPLFHLHRFLQLLFFSGKTSSSGRMGR